MDRTVYIIQMRHLRQAIEHLQIFDLDELDQSAQQHGSDADRALIGAVRACLPYFPLGRHP